MNNDLKLGLGLTAFCCLIWFWAIPAQIRGHAEAFFPRFITLFILVPSLLLVARGLRRPGDAAGKPLAATLREAGKSLGLAALFLGYIVLVGFAGFFPATVVAVPALMFFLGERNWKQLVFTPLVLTLLIYICIERTLSFPMPAGSLF